MIWGFVKIHHLIANEGSSFLFFTTDHWVPAAAHFKCNNSQLVMFYTILLIIITGLALNQRSDPDQILFPSHAETQEGRHLLVFLQKRLLIVSRSCLRTFVHSSVFFLPLSFFCGFLKAHISSHVAKRPRGVWKPRSTAVLPTWISAAGGEFSERK